MLAHELRNPLNPIVVAVELLRMQRDALDRRLVASIDIIDRQVQQMARLIDDLLDVARITRGRIQLHKGRVALADVVDRAVETVIPLIDQRGHRLEISSPPQPVWLDADLLRLTQVVANLLNNAAKCTSRRRRCHFDARQRHGISAQMLPHVFDTFSQTERMLDRAQGGLGLGLPLVRGLVELHGGNVRAISAGVGQGAEFVVRLPALAAEPQANEVAEYRMGAGRSAAAWVLIVEDNADAADSLAVLLETLGYEVRVEHNGAAAPAAAREFEPQAVLLDIGLPGMNGYGAAKHLRRQERPLLLIALTGYGDEASKKRAREAGFDHHLLKPVELDKLQALLAAAS